MKDITPMAQETGRPSDAPPAPDALSWRGDAPATAGRGEARSNFIGGSPAGVAARLVFVSLIVGALLMWLDIRPLDILRGLRRMIDGILHLGVDAIEMIFQYILAGAAIVVPIWLVIRLLNYRGAGR